jgi:hypothetical protein
MFGGGDKRVLKILWKLWLASWLIVFSLFLYGLFRYPYSPIRFRDGAFRDKTGAEFPADGVVKSIRFTDSGDVILELDSGQSLPITKLQEVVDGSIASSTAPTNAASTNASATSSLMTASYRA